MKTEPFTTKELRERITAQCVAKRFGMDQAQRITEASQHNETDNPHIEINGEWHCLKAWAALWQLSIRQTKKRIKDLRGSPRGYDVALKTPLPDSPSPSRAIRDYQLGETHLGVAGRKLADCLADTTNHDSTTPPFPTIEKQADIVAGSLPDELRGCGVASERLINKPAQTCFCACHNPPLRSPSCRDCASRHFPSIQEQENFWKEKEGRCCGCNLSIPQDQQYCESCESFLKSVYEESRELTPQLGIMMLIGGHLKTPEQMRKFIEGFN